MVNIVVYWLGYLDMKNLCGDTLFGFCDERIVREIISGGSSPF